MLLEFSCTNHRSIREEVLLSMIAGKDKLFVERTKDVDGVKVLKSAVIYGANGAGKSNLIDAISFVKHHVVNSIRNQPGQGMRHTPHKLDGFGKESTYKVQFVTKGVRYVYGFSLKNMLVLEEYLYYFPNGRQTKIFERSGESFSAGSKFRGRLNTCKDVLKPNRLLLSCAANFSKVEEIADVFHFFTDELIIYDDENQNEWLNYSLYQMYTNEKIKNAVLTFLDELGTGIRDIRLIKDQKDDDTIYAKVIYDEFESKLTLEESTGVRKLFAMLYLLIDIMINGKVLICDGFESGLHKSLVYELVNQFEGQQSEKFSQMIFTTHEIGLLSLDLFRRDQVWFAEMRRKDRSTDLYSLAEIINVRKEDNFGKAYITGKYGATPLLDLDFANVVSNM